MAISRGGKKLTPAEQKAAVKRWTGWTEKEYKREYMQLWKRTRNYETATGLDRGSLDVADILAREARSRYYARDEVGTPSAGKTYLYRAIQQAPTTSRGVGARAIARLQDIEETRVLNQFAGFVNRSKYGADIKRELSELSPADPHRGEKSRAIVEKYLKQADEERLAIAEYNRITPDPFGRRHYSSR